MAFIDAKRARALAERAAHEIERETQEAAKLKKVDLAKARQAETRLRKIFESILRSAIDGRTSINTKDCPPKLCEFLNLGFAVYRHNIQQDDADEKQELIFEEKFERLTDEFSKLTSAKSKGILTKEELRRLDEFVIDAILQIKHDGESRYPENPEDFVNSVQDQISTFGKTWKLDYDLHKLVHHLFEVAQEWGSFFLEWSSRESTTRITQSGIPNDDSVSAVPAPYTIKWNEKTAYSFWDIENVWSAESMAWISGRRGQEYLNAVQQFIESVISDGKTMAEIEYWEKDGWFFSRIGARIYEKVPQPKQMTEILGTLGFSVQESDELKLVRQTIKWGR